MIDSLAAPDPRENLVFLRPAVARNDQGDVLADCFVGGVAEDSLGRGIPRSDDAFEGFADYDVIGGFYDRGEMRCLFGR